MCDCKQGSKYIEPMQMAQNSVCQQPTFASLDSFRPRVIKSHITAISAILEPSPTTSTAALFTSLGSAALGACATEDYRYVLGPTRYCRNEDGHLFESANAATDASRKHCRGQTLRTPCIIVTVSKAR